MVEIGVYYDLRSGNLMVGIEEDEYIRDVYKILVIGGENGRFNIAFVSLTYPFFIKKGYDIEKNKDLIKISKIGLNEEDFKLYSMIEENFKKFLVENGIRNLIF